MSISPGKKLLFYAIMAFFTVSAVLAGSELLVRLFLPFYSIPDTVRKRSLQYVGSIFSRHRLKPIQFLEASSDGYFLNVNALGYRGRSFRIRKPKGVKRIIFIGGSSVFDVAMKDSSANGGNDWPHLAGRLLKQKGFKNIEVINAGVPGHASFDSLGRLYSELWVYEPDYVLYYGAWNDIKYFRELTPKKPLESLFKPYHQESDSNPFIEYQWPWDRFLSHSQFYVKLRNQYYQWKLRAGPEGAVPDVSGKEYQDHYSASAVKQYRLNVQMIVDACKNIGAIPVLLTEVTLVSAGNSPEERKKIAYEYVHLTHSALVKAFSETYQVIRSVGQAKEALVIDLAKELNGKRELFLDHVHLSKKGSEEVAKRVADFLAADLNAGSRLTKR